MSIANFFRNLSFLFSPRARAALRAKEYTRAVIDQARVTEAIVRKEVDSNVQELRQRAKWLEAERERLLVDIRRAEIEESRLRKRIADLEAEVVVQEAHIRSLRRLAQ